jgi:hypothetical protein
MYVYVKMCVYVLHQHIVLNTFLSRSSFSIGFLIVMEMKKWASKVKKTIKITITMNTMKGF